MESRNNFENAFVTLIAEMVEKKGITHSDFGKAVFGETSGARLWRSARSDRQRSISIGEAYKIAEVLEEDFPGLIWDLTKEAKNRGLI